MLGKGLNFLGILTTVIRKRNIPKKNPKKPMYRSLKLNRVTAFFFPISNYIHTIPKEKLIIPSSLCPAKTNTWQRQGPNKQGSGDLYLSVCFCRIGALISKLLCFCIIAQHASSNQPLPSRGCHPSPRQVCTHNVKTNRKPTAILKMQYCIESLDLVNLDQETKN